MFLEHMDCHLISQQQNSDFQAGHLKNDFMI